MGKFYCRNCDVSREFPDLDTALDKFDHAVALSKGRQCPNNNLEDFVWNGVIVAIIKNPDKYKPNVPPKLVERTVRFESKIMDSTKPEVETKPDKPKRTRKSGSVAL